MSEAAMFVATSVHSTMGKGAARRWRALWLVWVVVAWAALPSLAQRLTWLDTLDGRGSYALVIFLPPLTRTFGVQRSIWGYASGVSADGSVVVGVAGNAAGRKCAFRWTAAGGMQDLGTLGGSGSEANAVSADGSVVVGWAENAARDRRAFRWTAARGIQDLGTLGGDWSTARGVSADGSVVVGWAENAEGWSRAFRWTAAGGMQDLGTLGGDESVALGVSADGSVVVGWAYNAAGQKRAFRWTAAGGIQDLGTLGGDWSTARGVSADGSVVVGDAWNAAWQWRAFRWTAAGGMQDLGTLGGDWSEAYGVSADGSVVVGAAWNAAGQERAFRWTASGGMEDLNVTYAHLLTDGSVLYRAKAISPDGRYIVGQGYNAATGRREAFLLDTQGTGVEERSGAPGVRLRLLPQPAHERVVLEFEAAEAAGRVTIVVSDVLGRVVAEPLRGAVLPPGVQQRIELDVRAWAAGQYTVVLRTEAGSTAVPLVVVR
jgi:probable HAF family extracellular repeat protein